MKRIETDTLIIGAGPAGMAAALELAKAGKRFVVLEKTSSVGGLSKTYTFKEGDFTFYTDNGPHRFFSKNPYLYEMIGGLLNERWIKVTRQTRQYIDGKFYDYPVNALQALRNLGLWRAMRMGFDYLLAKIRYGLFKKKIDNFEDYVVANFGESLGRFNMINYTEKIWGIPAKEIHPDWAKQRIKGLNLTEVIKDAVRRIFSQNSANKPKTLVDSFYYPDQGTGLIYEAIRIKLEKEGYQFIFNANISSVETAAGRIKKVVTKTPEGEIEIVCSNLIESVPIVEFVNLLTPAPSKRIIEALGNLKYRHQVYIFITLDKEFVTKDQWIYFPSKNVPVARITEMKNFSPLMSPAGKTSLFVEYFCFEEDSVWTMDSKKLLELTCTHLCEAGLFERGEVRAAYPIRKENVYPIYDLYYEKFLDEIKSFLDSFSNLYYIGRPGRFRYNNQDHSLEMGIAAARSIIEGKRYSLDEIGGEKEYYESGSLYEKKKNES